jgi:chromosomal replication initiation ATPase DnaA
MRKKNAVIELTQEKRSHLDSLLMGVAHNHRVSVRQILSKCRQSEFVRARREFCKAARSEGVPLIVIGHVLGMHHSSVVHLLKPR